jgi:colanic acid/amylovoran biosynthesis glycosyltransferase
VTRVDGARPLRLAYLLPTFPELSNTFVIEQITGMIDRGHDVDLFAVARRSFADLPTHLERYELERRMRHLPVPRGRLARVGSALRLLTGPGGPHRSALDALNPLRHGRRATTLGPIHTAASFLRSGPYDVLHCHFGQWGPLAVRLVRLGAIDAALVTAFRGADLASIYPKNPRRFAELFRHGDLHLPVSADFERRLHAANVPPERVVVHHDGIDLRRFPFVERRPADDGVARLLFVGRLAEKKGIVYALDALATLIRSGRRAELTIIGDGPLGPELRARSQELGVANHTRFLGRRPLDEVAHTMRTSHVLVAPSVTAANGDQEGIPTVIKEAMATGMPVVSTLHSGIPELVDHGVTGLVAPERDAQALSDHLATLLDHPERWTDMGRAGRRRVEAEFDTERLNDQLVERYREAMARRAARPAE